MINYHDCELLMSFDITVQVILSHDAKLFFGQFARKNRMKMRTFCPLFIVSFKVYYSDLFVFIAILQCRCEMLIKYMS